MQPPARPPDRLAPLTSARFFAAFSVVIHHAGGPAFANAPEWAASLREFGAVAVRFFFVLSGFVLALKYADTARVPRIDARRFWLARFARIYPVYFVALVLYGIVAARIYPPAAPERDRVAGILSLLLVQSWSSRHAVLWNFPAWSLSDEAFFYFLFPFVLPILRRRWTPGALLAGVGALWLLELLVDAVLSIGTPLSRLPEFLVGALLGRLLLADRERGVARPGRVLAAIGLAAALAIGIVFTRVPSRPLFDVLTVLPFGLVVYGLAHTPSGGRGILSHPFLVLLGDASYSLYILQLPVALGLRVALGHDGAVARWSLPLSLAYAVILVLVSVASLVAIERPAQARILGRQPRADP